MAATIITIEGIAVARGSRKAPRRLVRGRRLKALQKAIHSLNVLQSQDDAENRRSAVKGYTPYLVLDLPGSDTADALETLTGRLADALGAKA